MVLDDEMEMLCKQQITEKEERNLPFIARECSMFLYIPFFTIFMKGNISIVPIGSEGKKKSQFKLSNFAEVTQLVCIARVYYRYSRS